MAELSKESKSVLMSYAKTYCIDYWSSVNDPPCHPSDDDWKGCVTCINISRIIAVLTELTLNLKPRIHPNDIQYIHQMYLNGFDDAVEMIKEIIDELKSKPINNI